MVDMTKYNETFFRHQSSAGRPSVQKIAPLLIRWIGPKSVADVGCGLGDWAAGFVDRGVSDVLAIDGDYVDRQKLNVPGDQFESHDLSVSLRLDRKFDLAVCLEVAEHLDPSRASGFIDDLTNLADAVLFSAAAPGQGGTHHVNEQWPAFWAKHFENSEFRCFDVLRFLFWEDEDVAVWYRQNMLLFAKIGSDVESAIDERSRGLASACLKPLIHPMLYGQRLAAAEYRVGSKVGLKGWIKAVPRRLR